MLTDIEIIQGVIKLADAWKAPDTVCHHAIEAGISIATILKVKNGGFINYGEWGDTKIRTLMSSKINKLFDTEPDLAVEYLLNNFKLVDHSELFFKNKFHVYAPTDVSNFPNLVKKRRSGLMTDKEMNRFCRDQPAAANLVASCVVHGLSDQYAALIEQPNFKKYMTKDQIDRVVDSLIKSGLQRNALMDEHKLGVRSVSSSMAILNGLFKDALGGKNKDKTLPSTLCGDHFVRDHAHHILDELKEYKFREPDFVIEVLQELRRLDVDMVLMAKVIDAGRYAYFDFKDRVRNDNDPKEALDIAWGWRGLKGMHFCTAFVVTSPLELIQAHPDAQKILKMRHAVTGEKELLPLIADRKYRGQALEGALGI
jgi:hypothetical protein